MVEVGNGIGGYNKIVNAFVEYKIGSYALAIILNPIAEGLPRIPILAMPTGNCFDSNFVYHQWQEVINLYEIHLEDILGPLIGNSSDGDSRRRHNMLKLASSEAVNYRPIPENLGFVFGALKIEKLNEQYTLRHLPDQDYVHVHKRLINMLDYSSRVLMMGDLIANHIQLVYETFGEHVHGLSLEDIDRQDCQNWRTAQKLAFKVIRDCLQHLIDGRVDGRPADPLLIDTKLYLLVVFYYVEIFCSPVASLRQ